MATILQGGPWLISDDAAAHLEKLGVLRECINNHPVFSTYDKPIYHLSFTPPEGICAEALYSIIKDAEKAVGN